MVRENNPNQLSIEDIKTPFYRGLDKNNRWVRLAQVLPWEMLHITILGLVVLPPILGKLITWAFEKRYIRSELGGKQGLVKLMSAHERHLVLIQERNDILQRKRELEADDTYANFKLWFRGSKPEELRAEINCLEILNRELMKQIVPDRETFTSVR